MGNFFRQLTGARLLTPAPVVRYQSRLTLAASGLPVVPDGVLARRNARPVRLVGTPALMVVGVIFYSLYLIHIARTGPWRSGMDAVGIDAGPLHLLSTLFLIASTMGLAHLIRRIVEEPTRQGMRKAGVRPVPVEEVDEQAR